MIDVTRLLANARRLLLTGTAAAAAGAPFASAIAAPPPAERYYSSCVASAKRTRPDDYQSFCTCYANAAVEMQQNNPSDTFQEHKISMAAAYKRCGVGAPIVERMNREARRRESERQNAPAVDESSSRSLQPWQQMQRRLLEPSSR